MTDIKLPELCVEIVGQVKSSNLAVYESTALEFIRSINTDLQTDDDFARAEQMVKFCDKAEKELDKAKTAAMERTADISALFATVDTLRDEMRAKRLELNRLVKARKDAIRAELINTATNALHTATIRANAEFSVYGVQLPAVAADFAGVVKGKRTVKSLELAIDTELNRAVSEVESLRAHIADNLKLITSQPPEFAALFPDLQMLTAMRPGELSELISERIAAHKKAEAERLEAERERIREEEKRKAEAEAARIREEERRKAEEWANAARLANDERIKASEEARRQEEMRALAAKTQHLPQAVQIEEYNGFFDDSPAIAPSFNDAPDFDDSPAPLRNGLTVWRRNREIGQDLPDGQYYSAAEVDRLLEQLRRAA
ncbi:hypothetical protein GCM10023116_43280 [Kistimonas scapharcae]|uniref:Uncharacterized protein n=1 Tax=Kistimonas scapharcae TaxID=1036133 RepID=A0ABP8V7U6_9GAMM